MEATRQVAPDAAVPPTATRAAGAWLARLGAALRRLARRVGVGLVATAAAASVQAPAAAQAVPQHWISYAQLVGNQLQDRLGDPASEPVLRLHAWMQERMLQDGQALPPQPVVVRLWIAPDGRIGRLEFDTLGRAQADADLRSVVATQPLAEPPPADMRQPLVLQLSLSVLPGA